MKKSDGGFLLTSVVQAVVDAVTNARVWQVEVAVQEVCASETSFDRLNESIIGSDRL